MSRDPLESTLINHNIECLSVSWCSSPCVLYQKLYCILRWINFHHILCITFWNDNVVIMIICSTLYCMIKSIHVHPTSDIMSDDNEMVRRVNLVINLALCVILWFETRNTIVIIMKFLRTSVNFSMKSWFTIYLLNLHIKVQAFNHVNLVHVYLPKKILLSDVDTLWVYWCSH
jgi:hypothetical protein